MDDFSAPSFSLGLDLDLDLADLPTEGEEDNEKEQRELPLPTPATARGSPTFDLLSDEEFEEDLGLRETPTPNPNQDPPHPPALKRLRRGLPPPPPPWLPSPAAAPPCDGGGGGDHGPILFTDVDDEIEEFSSQEERLRGQGGCSSVQSCKTRSSSKFLLHNHGILTSQQTSKLKAPKISPASDASTLTIIEQSCNKKLFPKLTISPLRKIYLLDSDSDDPSSEDEYEDGKEVDKSQERRPVTTMTRNGQEKSSLQANKAHGEFWKDSSPKKNMKLETPALDEFCEEYFRSMKDQNSVHSKEEDMSFCSSRILDADGFVEDFEDHHQQKHINGRTQQNRNLPSSQPPAFCYFYHSDSSIRTLVQKRLPFFNLLGAEKYRGNEESGAENFDYMSQFGHKDVPRQAQRTCERRSEGISKRRRKPNSDNLEEGSHASGSWVNPRSNAKIPKDAGKRRVRADGRQSGHWFTGQDGRKVYVSKNGEELTGQIAYKQYRKESGMGFRKSRKKVAVQKKRKR
ncbi:hypothetical protein COCNU_12G003320 [Cocos nucifera]|uniref:Uncharacterized protein n=1 Tax=Cocos nucifera TaxID=13894 RepID=A0A8K0IR75_COCNU|nr:hypothetical protein COCNU_12G003320 [Cocos nucifera]